MRMSTMNKACAHLRASLGAEGVLRSARQFGSHKIRRSRSITLMQILIRCMHAHEHMQIVCKVSNKGTPIPHHVSTT